MSPETAADPARLPTLSELRPRRPSTVSGRRFFRLATPNRWAIAVASCVVQLALGSIYASSVLLTPVMEQYGVSRAAANLTFTITIAALGITAGFGGALQRRYGPRAIATLSGILYGGGVCLAAVAPNVATLYVTFGAIGGIGLGLGYIVPVAMLIRWFPDKRGLISGLAVAGFGGGAMVASPVAAVLLRTVGLHQTLLALGLVYLVIIILAAQFFRAAPEGYVPQGWTPPAGGEHGRDGRHYTLAEALRSRRWYLLWLILALNVTAGAALISVAAPLAHDLCGVAPSTAALAIIAISLTNGLGRPLWGWASDRIGRPATFLGLFLIQFLAFRALAQLSDFGPLLLLFAAIGMCFCAGFAAMPAFAADFFGSKHAGAIYGAMLTAWSAGATAGPILIASVDYRTAASLLSWLMLASAALPLWAGRRSFARRLQTGATRLADEFLAEADMQPVPLPYAAE